MHVVGVVGQQLRMQLTACILIEPEGGDFAGAFDV
jgi:hypothetical protein